MPLTVRLTAPDEPLYAGASALFDEYRQHYGANPAPELVTEWLLNQILSPWARIYAAAEGTDAVGICTVAIVPAALTLRPVWLVRDLFVAPQARRRGVARALLTLVAQQARLAGAHRLSLNTDIANGRATELYNSHGFEVLTDVAVVDLVL